MDELRRSSGGGEEPLEAADVGLCGPGEETLINDIVVEADDLLESVGEIGGETERFPGTDMDRYSEGDFVGIGIGGSGGGR
jgi:hypothetical protein